MRRIITAMALVSAMASGCSMAAKQEAAATGTSKGTFGINFVVSVDVPLGGIVTAALASAPTRNVVDCGASSTAVAPSGSPPRYDFTHYDGAALCAPATVAWADSVTLTADPQGTNAFIGWAGDCVGSRTTCTLTSTGGDKYVVAIFGPPGSAHANYMLDLQQHVTDYLAATLRCETCHGASGVGSGIAPACAACHNGRPGHHLVPVLPAGTFPQPAAGFMSIAGHGASYLAGIDCTGCHGATLTGKGSANSCAQCHGLPHDPTTAFADPAVHGPAFAASAAACATCHGANLSGAAAPLKANSCAQCHGEPHDPSSAYGAGAVHGPDYAVAAASCASCHGGDLSGGTSGVSCTRCHGAPHDPTAAFASPAVHGPAYAANGSACATCHGASLGGAAAPLTANSCTQCHGAAHDQTGAFAAPTAHGPAYAANPGSCTACHGPGLTGGISGVSCTRCHGAPHDPTAAFAAATAHGPAYAASAASCATCHGASLTGLNTAPRCTQCHPKPHDPTAAYGTLAAHGTDYLALFPGSGYGTGCSYGTLPANTCTACHGSDLKGRNGAPSCAQCHAPPPLQTVLTAGHNHFACADGSYTAGGDYYSTCRRCHRRDGFDDYVGAYGTDAATNLSGSFFPRQRFFGYGPLRCATCHNAKTEPSGTGLTQILFPGSAGPVTTDTVSALCAQCHQGRSPIEPESGVGFLAALDTNLATANKGLVQAGLRATATGTTSTMTTAARAANYAGYVGVFWGAVTDALNGVRVRIVSDSGTTLTFSPAVSSAPVASDGMWVYPVATGGTTTSLVDSYRAWSATGSGQWANFSVRFVTGANAGKYRRIVQNDGTTLTFASALPGAVAAGDVYVIIPESQTAIVDAQPATNNTMMVAGHYYPSGATVFGAEGGYLYQYASTDTGEAVYSARAAVTKCSGCHDVHDGTHGGYVDASGDQAKATQLTADLLKAMQAYTINMPDANVPAGAKYICASTSQGANGAWGAGLYVDPTNNLGACVYTSWYHNFTPRLARAAYNYTAVWRDHGAYAHNPRYVQQVLYDAIIDLNAGMTAAGVASNKLVTPSYGRPAP